MSPFHPHDEVEQRRRRELLSDLVDGRCRAEQADEALRGWKDDERWRRDWRTYHVIGDVLRSDELARKAGHDAGFLRALRVALAAEPVALAPARQRQDRSTGSRRWLGAAAAVAGFAVVGATVLVLRPGEVDRGSGWAAAQTEVIHPAGSVSRLGTEAALAASQSRTVEADVIRDARLDAYFEAHHGAVGPAPVAMPGGALRSVEILLPRR